MGRIYRDLFENFIAFLLMFFLITIFNHPWDGGDQASRFLQILPGGLSKLILLLLTVYCWVLIFCITQIRWTPDLEGEIILFERSAVLRTGLISRPGKLILSNKRLIFIQLKLGYPPRKVEIFLAKDMDIQLSRFWGFKDGLLVPGQGKPISIGVFKPKQWLDSVRLVFSSM